MRTILFFILLGISIQSHAAISPVYKECMQRGYQVSGDSCVFPDGSKCSLESFNNGTCGEAFFTDDYCIPEGQVVWDENRCCEGLAPYLEEGVAGQPTCEPEKSMFGGIAFWIGLFIIPGFLFAIMFQKKK